MQYLLILWLIVCPWQPCVPTTADATAWGSLKHIAFALELVGSHERWATDFRNEVAYVRRHWFELHAAPPLSDCWRLPSFEQALEAGRFNWQCQDSLRLRLCVERHRREELEDALQDTCWLYGIWELIREARCEQASWASRRRALLQLRERIGPEVYCRGAWPPALPVWRFAELP